MLAGETPVLVHNCNGRDPVDGRFDDDTYDRIDSLHGPDIADGVEYQYSGCTTAPSLPQITIFLVSGITPMPRLLISRRGEAR